MITFPVIAQAVIDIPAGQTMKTLWGLIGIMVLAITALTLVLLCKKVFGRKPPLDKALELLEKKLVGVVMHQKNSALKEMGGQHGDHDRRLLALEHWRTALTNQLEKDKAEIIKAGEDRAVRIHEHIEKDRVAMDEKVESHRRALADKIENLPDRIISMLKHTNAI